VTPLRIVVLLAGIAVLLGDAYSVLTVLIVPRAASSWLTYPMVATQAVFRRVAMLARTFTAKDRVLALSEPVALIVLVTTWLTMAVIGFTLVNWDIGSQPITVAFSEAGSSVFTLGFTLSHTEGSRVVEFVAAGTGMVLVALQIAYLPTLYAAYNRRETLVTLLESQAGAPAWGPELLIRHQLVGVDREPAGRDGRGGHGPGDRSGGRPDRGEALHPHGLHVPAGHRPRRPDPLRPRSAARRSPRPHPGAVRRRTGPVGGRRVRHVPSRR
jgi:hypothetical protein